MGKEVDYMKKMHPKGKNGILSLILGIIFLVLFIPSFFAIIAISFNTILIALFFIGLIMSFCFCSEFLGNKIVICDDVVIIYKWYKEFCRIEINQITDVRMGHFCKEWWSHGDKVISLKVFTKENNYEFPIQSYSKNQCQELVETLKSQIK